MTSPSTQNSSSEKKDSTEGERKRGRGRRRRSTGTASPAIQTIDENEEEQEKKEEKSDTEGVIKKRQISKQIAKVEESEKEHEVIEIETESDTLSEYVQTETEPESESENEKYEKELTKNSHESADEVEIIQLETETDKEDEELGKNKTYTGKRKPGRKRKRSEMSNDAEEKKNKANDENTVENEEDATKKEEEENEPVVEQPKKKRKKNDKTVIAIVDDEAPSKGSAKHEETALYEQPSRMHLPKLDETGSLCRNIANIFKSWNVLLLLFHNLLTKYFSLYLKKKKTVAVKLDNGECAGVAIRALCDVRFLYYTDIIEECVEMVMNGNDLQSVSARLEHNDPSTVLALIGKWYRDITKTQIPNGPFAEALQQDEERLMEQSRHLTDLHAYPLHNRRFKNRENGVFDQKCPICRMIYRRFDVLNFPFMIEAVAEWMPKEWIGMTFK
ncbi:hypothetical protein RFI_27277, partial [Reticulomyxa filosa]